MARTNFINPQNLPAAEKPEREESREPEQLRLFGIADEEHQETLKYFLNEQDFNCMGIMPPATENESQEETVRKVAAMPIDVLVLFAKEFDKTQQDFMHSFCASRRGVASVLVTDTEISVELLQTAMSCGINNVVYVSASDKDKDKVCDIIRGEAAKTLNRAKTAEVLEYDSRVILTYSSKGGAGKTTLAVNLAAALVHKGKKVTIIDLDLASGDVHSFLGIGNGESIAELAEEPQPITPTTIKSYVHQTDSKIGVLCAPSAPQHARTVQPELVSKVITTLRADNDYVIVDCDQQIVNGTIAKCCEEAMRAADLILFIVTPEVPTINGAYDMINKYLNRFTGIPEKIRVVVNKSGSASTITLTELSDTLGKPIFAEIPDDYRVAVQTMNIGVPFMAEGNEIKLPFFQRLFRRLFRRPIKKAYDKLTALVIEAC